MRPIGSAAEQAAEIARLRHELTQAQHRLINQEREERASNPWLGVLVPALQWAGIGATVGLAPAALAEAASGADSLFLPVIVGSAAAFASVRGAIAAIRYRAERRRVRLVLAQLAEEELAFETKLARASATTGGRAADQ
jgi:hypothetical protein